MTATVKDSAGHTRSVKKTVEPKRRSHIVAARLGDDPRTVLSTYAHLLPQSDELAAERVATLLAG